MKKSHSPSPTIDGMDDEHMSIDMDMDMDMEHHELDDDKLCALQHTHGYI